MTPFQYRSLETPHTIRLALIPPSGSIAENEQLKIRLGHADITKVKGRYVALSYTWGDPTLTHTILINGSEFQITKNLEFFLRRPRNDRIARTESMYFWIDAICINQEDEKEKALQIPLMKLIYEGSLYVHAELGPASEDQERAAREIPLISQAVMQEYHRVSSSNIERGSFMNHMRVSYVKDYDSALWSNISEMITLPWWKRAWIMQEASVIKNVEINYGNTATKMFDMKAIHLAVILMRRRGKYDADTTTLPNTGPLQRIIDVSTLRDTNPTLLEVLKLFRGLQATKTHDIVYASANLAVDLKPGEIKVDYNRKISELFSDVVAYYLRHLPVPLDVLENSGQLHLDLDVKDGFTTWIPQWQNRLPPDPFVKAVGGDQTQYTRIYNALGRSRPMERHAEPSVQPSEIGPLLTVRGYKVDVIRSVQYPDLKFNAFEGASVINTWVPQNADKPYPPNVAITRLEAFLRTIIADFDSWSKSRGNKAPWDFEKHILLSSHKDFSHVHTRCHFRRLAETRKEYLALVDFHVREDDEIFLLYGGSVPYVLRPVDDKYYFVGECYVHGIMDGEAVEDSWSPATANEIVIC